MSAQRVSIAGIHIRFGIDILIRGRSRVIVVILNVVLMAWSVRVVLEVWTRSNEDTYRDSLKSMSRAAEKFAQK